MDKFGTLGRPLLLLLLLMMMMIGITTVLVASTSAPLASMRIHSPNILQPHYFRGEAGKKFSLSLYLRENSLREYY
ncbi:hypothetical protein I7I53_03329 [Histoplasma capsulatum var. duboisii H88]|uniref:Uncharacterized protein n=1 Tax=Ajellomyces capsulatus (strain H88) TaxID=544711 RepID=A0A8A1LQQ3_AJEC8|nr:hypothetical protein I7I53_03329 [Histoplasma capsulatum var. duboisii H88]